MKSIIKLLGIVVFFLTSFSFGQNKNTLSDGVLEIDGAEKIDVKLNFESRKRILEKFYRNELGYLIF